MILNVFFFLNMRNDLWSTVNLWYPNFIHFRVFFEKRFNLPANRANFVNSLLYFIAAFLAPALGIVIDKFGKNVTFVFLSLLITILGHILLTLPNIDPIISMVSILFYFSPQVWIVAVLLFVNSLFCTCHYFVLSVR